MWNLAFDHFNKEEMSSYRRCLEVSLVNWTCKYKTLSGTLPAASIPCSAWTCLLQLSHNHLQLSTTSLPEPSPMNLHVFQPHLLKKARKALWFFHCIQKKDCLSNGWALQCLTGHDLFPKCTWRTALLSHQPGSQEDHVHGIFFLPVVTKKHATK